jgi:hypothetical protein
MTQEQIIKRLEAAQGWLSLAAVDLQQAAKDLADLSRGIEANEFAQRSFELGQALKKFTANLKPYTR